MTALSYIAAILILLYAAWLYGGRKNENGLNIYRKASNEDIEQRRRK